MNVKKRLANAKIKSVLARAQNLALKSKTTKMDLEDTAHAQEDMNISKLV